MKKNSQISFKNVIVQVSFICFIVIGMVAILNFFILPVITRSKEIVAVPSLIGMDEKSAIELLKSKNLRYSIEESSTFNKHLEENLVISQSIEPDENVKRNRVILITINKKKFKSVRVPDIRHNTLRNAIVVLENLGLKLGKLSYVEDVAHNLVLEQFVDDQIILPGTEIAEGVAISLKIGVRDSAHLVSVPSLRELNEDQIENKLLESNLKLAKIIYIDSSDKTENSILYTNPEEGASVPIDTEVCVYISK